jgi:hypothetical protein
MHAKRHLSYDDQSVGVVWTQCTRHVPQAEIAAFREGVTCKNCIKVLEFHEECERDRIARRERMNQSGRAE